MTMPFKGLRKFWVQTANLVDAALPFFLQLAVHLCNGTLCAGN